MSDTDYMQRAIELARQGEGFVSPNPMVGAVLVKGDRIIGEGYHRYDRLKHAESFALETAGKDAEGASLYCSLEPCCHHGRTPPCTDSLIAAGIKRAVIATADPDSRVNGQGIELLRAAGIEVEVGLLASEAVRLNEAYNKYVTDHVPFVHALIAPEPPDLLRDWKPSSRLLHAASLYDALVLGDRRLNTFFLEACLSRERHRPFIVIGDAEADVGSNLQMNSSASASISIARDPREVFVKLVELRATSVLFLPGSVNSLDPDAQKIDKLTMVQSKNSNKVFSSLRYDVESVEELDAGRFVEITGMLNENKRVD
jgi:pyrimidine deaminase RibD-like protein